MVGAAGVFRARDSIGNDLRDWRLAAIVLLTAALIGVAALVPKEYLIRIGVEEGFHNDQPFIRGMFAPDSGPFGTFRWTSERTAVSVRGLGPCQALVSFRVLPIPQNALAAGGPMELELWRDDRALATLPLRPTGTRFHLLLSPAGDRHVLDIRSATWQPEGDPRRLGVPLSTTSFRCAEPRGPMPQSFGWLIVVALAWIGIRAAGNTRDVAALGALALALVIGVIHVTDPPRAAFGVAPFQIALALGIGLVVVLRWGAPPLLNRLGVAWSGASLRWLLLLALVVFVTRYGGRLLPGAMPGDIGFHSNRFDELVSGDVYLEARNRGANFPYPPGYYLILAPLALLDVSRRTLLPLGTAVLDAASPIAVYVLGTCVYGATRWGERTSVLAAALYAFAGAGLLAHWWHFSTHMFTQFMFLVLLAGIMLFWRSGAAQGHAASRWWPAAALAALFGVVFLGHFGFFLNTILLMGGALVIGAAYAWQRVRRQLTALVLSAAGALGFSGLMFYSLYTRQFARQAAMVGAAAGAGAASDPERLRVYWDTVLQAGLRDHYGLFLPPLALVGLWLLIRRKGEGRSTELLVILSLGTLGVVLAFAVLPFISGANLASRWLSFAGWFVATGAAPALRALWRRGGGGKVAVGCVLAYALWISVTLWLAPMVWRIRPPEPF